MYADGLANERTRLAWQRTGLAGLTASLVVARLLVPVSAVLAVVVAAVAVAGSVALGRFAAQRYWVENAALLDEGPLAGDSLLADDAPLTDGRAALVVAALTGLAAVAALLYVGAS
jgi:hypothetical protein